MTDQFKQLRATILNELEKPKPSAAEAARAAQGTKRFAAYLMACLVNMDMSPDEFARRLKVESELAIALLDGLLPESEIDDGWLSEIARVIQRQPNVLRALLGRTIHIDRDKTSSVP